MIGQQAQRPQLKHDVFVQYFSLLIGWLVRHFTPQVSMLVLSREPIGQREPDVTR